jgi:hypothetical protein
VRRVPLLLAIAAACGGRSDSQRAQLPDEAPAPCRQGPTTDCLAARIGACRSAAAPASRLAWDTLPPLTVGPGGLVRVDHLGGTLVGVDSTRWLACFEQCPDGGPTKVCFPLALPLRLAWSAGAGCQRRERAADPWQGRASRAIDLTCPDGSSTIRVAPDLDRARRDLVSAGAIDGADVLAGLDGLAVEMRAADTVQSRLVTAAGATCDAFALPPGYRVIGDPTAFGELESAASEPAAALAGEVEKIRAAVAVQAVAGAKSELLPRFRTEHGEDCRARGFDPADPARLEACAAASKDTEAPFRAAVSRETARLLAGRRAELDALTRNLLIAPICRHYAGKP